MSTDPQRDDSTAGGEPEAGDDRSKAEIEADILETREHLAETVDALSHKMDVKTRTRAKARSLQADHGQEIAIGAGVAVVLVALLLWRRRRR